MSSAGDWNSAGVNQIAVEAVPVDERAPLLAAYEQAYGKMPTVAAVLRALPDPADRPTFRISASHREGGSEAE